MTVDKEVLMKLSKEELIQLFDTALQGQVLANDNMSKLGKLLAQAGEKIAQLESDKVTMEAKIIELEVRWGCTYNIGRDRD